MLLARIRCVRALRPILLAAGAVGLVLLVRQLGAGQIASALGQVRWWQFAGLCALYGLNVAIDATAWRYTLARDVPLLKLVLARCAGEAANALTALASIGGEAVKAWLVRVEVPYRESIPSLILAKTAEQVAQLLLLCAGIVVAWNTAVVGPTLRAAMLWLLVGELIGVGGFVLVQVAGVARNAGRLLSAIGFDGAACGQELDAALRGFYRKEWRRFIVATVLHLLGWTIGVVDAFVIMHALGLAPSFALATVVEALWCGVRFATFFIPASLGPLEGASAAAFPALGITASAGLAFTLVRRARQLVWIGLGAAILLAMRPARTVVGRQPSPAARGGRRLIT